MKGVGYMPIEKKNCRIELEGDQHKSVQYLLQDNPNLCVQHVPVNVGQKVRIVDKDIIDTSTNKHALINCECIFVEKDPRYPRCLWYYFEAVDNPELNVFSDNKFPQKYYKILESTSPYIVLL